MSYSNDLTQIRAGLTNFIGACLAASPFESRAARHTVASVLIEEALKLSQDKEGEPFDLYVLKPLFRGTALTLRQRANELKKLPPSSEVNDRISDYVRLADELDTIVKIIK